MILGLTPGQCALAALIVLVWVAAFSLAVKLRNTRLPAFLGLLGCVLYWAVPSDLAESTRVVVVADTTVSSLDARLRQLEESLHVDACVLLRVDEKSTHAPSDDSSWSERCSTARPEAVPGVASGLREALARFERVSGRERFLDALLGVQPHVVILSGEERFGATSGTSVDVSDIIVQMNRAGVVVDMPAADTVEQSSRPPELVIEPRQSSAAAYTGKSVDAFSFGLVLRGAQTPRNVAVECVYGGSCFEDAEDSGCPSNWQCTAGQCARPCKGDGGCAAETMCRDGVCVDASWTLEATAFPPRAPTPVRRGTEWFLGERSLSELSVTRTTQKGWVPIHCRASYEDVDGARRAVHATRYVRSQNGEWKAIVGTGGALDDPGDPFELSFDRVSEALQSAYIDHNFVSSLVFQGARDEQSVDPAWISDEKLDLLVVLDGSKAFWEKHCKTVTSFVRGGGRLLVSVAPPEVPECPLPVFAATDGTGEARMLDRRPELTIVGDPSRIGRMPFASLPAKESNAGLEDSKAVTARPLTDGVTVQRAVLSGLASALDHSFSERGFSPNPIPAQGPAPKREPLFKFTSFDPAALERDDGGTTTSQMAAKSDFARVNVQGAPQLRVGIEDTLVLFAYDIATAGNSSVLTKALAEGKRVVVVPLYTPFGAAVPGKNQLVNRIRSVSASRDGELRDVRPRDRVLVATVANVVPALEWSDGKLDLASESVLGDAEKLGQTLGKYLTRIATARTAYVARIEHFQRYLEDRRTKAVDDRLFRYVDRTETLPLRFQKLVPQPERARELFDLRLVEADNHETATFALGFGATLGQGHILTLGYSLFEGARGEALLRVPGGKDLVQVGHDPSNVWGPVLLTEFARLTDRLERLPTEQPRLVGLSVADRRFFSFEVAQKVDVARPVDTLIAVRGENAAFACGEADAAKQGVELALEGMDADRQILSYGLSPLQRQRLCGGQACVVSLCRSACADVNGTDCTLTPVDVQVFLEESPLATTSALADLRLMEQLRLLQSLTGGSKESAPAAGRRDLRPQARLAVLAALALFFAHRAHRRWGIRRLLAVMRSRRAAEDPSHGLLRGAGEALGIPSPLVPAGAFAGLRPLAPGDNLRALDRGDLLAATALRGSSLAFTPRVAQRIDPRTRTLCIFLDVRSSMRTPGPANAPPKLMAARRAVDVLIQAAASLNVRVELTTLGQHGTPLSAGPFQGGRADGAVDEFFQRVSDLPSANSFHIDDALEPGVSIVVISDFLGVALDALSVTAASAELEGTQVGFIALWSKREWSQLHFGWFPGGGLAERGPYGKGDLREAYRRHHARVALELEASFGGVTTLGAEQPDEQFVAALVEGPIMELLR